MDYDPRLSPYYGILFAVLSISSSHLCDLGPRLFSCSTNISSMPASLLFFSAAIPFLYCSSTKGNNIEAKDGSDLAHWKNCRIIDYVSFSSRGRNVYASSIIQKI